MRTHANTILVTGGTGFIGRRIVASLIERGRGVSIFAADVSPGGASPAAGFIRGDIRDRGALREAARGAGGIIHAAAAVSAWSSDPAHFLEINGGGTRNVVDAALEAGGVPVVYISSCSAIAFAGSGIRDETSIVPRTEGVTPYGMSKVLGEREVERGARLGLPTVIVYPTRVFGTGCADDANAATEAISMYIHGRLNVIPGRGAHANWGFADDIGAGVAGALLAGTPGERYILGGENLTLKEVFALSDEILGTRRRTLPVPLGAGRFIAHLEEARAHIARSRPRITRAWYDAVFEDTQLSTAKARKEIGYRVTPFRRALEIVLQWLAPGGTGPS